MLAGEFNIGDLLEEYSKKCGLYDDHVREQAVKLKNYKGSLETLDKKFLHLIMNHAIF
jgi:hypothetical protein